MPICPKSFIHLGRQDKIIYLWLFLIAFAAAFSSTYNPFNFRIMHVDSSVYITMAQGIIRGHLPYLDMVDNKGPLTYFLSVPGLFLGGFTGIWITELLLIFVSVLFAYKTALFFGNKNSALFGTIFSFAALLAFFLVNAGTEEYSLPFLTISLYIFTKYFFSETKDIKFTELLVLGICFASAVLVRLNMFPLWAGFSIIMFIESIIKKRFIFAGKCIIGFLLGAMVIFIPVYIYLRTNGIMDAFIEQVILAGSARGFGGTSLKIVERNFFLVLGRNNCTLPLWIGIFWVFTKYKQPYFTWYLSYTFSYFLMVLFLSFSGGGVHYNLILIPFFVPALTYLAGVIYRVFPNYRMKRVLFVIFFCCLFMEGLIRYAFNMTTRLHNNSGNHLISAGKMIDENTKPGDKIISLGINGYIYPFTQREPASKYFFQGSGIDSPDAMDTFISGILSSKPAIIATVTEDGRDEILHDWHAPILEMMETEYRLLSDEYGHKIFIRKE